MPNVLQKIRWDFHCYKKRLLTIWGLENGFFKSYDDELIMKLRNVFYGGIPASVILLCNSLTNGYCYDCALLLAKAFLENEDEDIFLICASINSLRLKPEYICDNPLYADHCFLERVTKDGRHLIYDTTFGFVYDKSLYWLIESPKVRVVNNKETIRAFIEKCDEFNLENLNNSKYFVNLVLSFIEKSYDKSNEYYSKQGIDLLQREILHYKEVSGYTNSSLESDIKCLDLK